MNRSVHNPDLRSADGSLSAELVAELFGLEVEEIEKLPIEKLSTIAMIRDEGFGNEQFRLWLREPNKYMSGRSPLDWIRDGYVHDVAGFVHGILSGQPS